MKRLTTMAAIIALAGCSQGASTFGKSYDECILKNARTGGDERSRDEAREICARHFIRKPTKAEIGEIKIGTVMAFDQPTYGGTEDIVHVGIENDSRNIVVLKVGTAVAFYSKPRGPDGKFNDADFIDEWVWTLDINTQPGERNSTTGTMTPTRAPSRYYEARTVLGRVLPLG